jgi:hypothetical protein
MHCPHHIAASGGLAIDAYGHNYVVIGTSPFFQMSSNSLPALHSHRTFAEFLCSDPELLVFRRFDLLNARALLYMQSELTCLEYRLHEFDDGDEKDGSIDAMMPALCFETILLRAAANNLREVERLRLIRQIQDLTFQYSASAWSFYIALC